MANNMDPDQTAMGAVLSEFIWFASMKQSSLNCT